MNSKTILALAALLCVVLISHPTFRANAFSSGDDEIRNTTNKSNSTRIKHVGNRISGGTKVTCIQPGHVTLWLWAKETNAPDHAFLGSAIRIAKDRFIASPHAVAKIRSQRPSVEHIGTDKALDDHPASILFDTPLTINVNLERSFVSKKQPTYSNWYTFDDPGHQIGSMSFRLFKLIPTNTALHGKPVPDSPIATYDNNPNDFGKDCHAYGWAYTSQNYISTDTRVYSSLPVLIQSCDKTTGYCRLRVNLVVKSSDAVCRGWGDEGTPVYCTHNDGQKKLTYIIEKHQGFDSCVKNDIRAWHIPHFARILNQLKQIL